LIEPARQVRIRIDQDQARLGLSSASIAAVLNKDVGRGRDPGARWHLPGRRRHAGNRRAARFLSTLRNLQFPLPNGRTVPLGQFATLDFGQEFPLIWRRDGLPTLTIQADVTQGASPEAVVAALAPAVAKLEASLPKSYHIAVGGTVEESALSQASVYAVISF
jgi:multidrug efflux pump subunit AcrB